MTITIHDNQALYKCLQQASYLTDDIIIDIDKTQLQINAKNMIARLSINSACASADAPCKIVLTDIKLLITALSNAISTAKEQFVDAVNIDVTANRLTVKTNNSKTVLQQASIDIIQSAANPLQTLPASAMLFTLDKQSIKKINSSMIFISNTADARIELGQFDDIQDKTLLGAKIFAANTPLSNYSIFDVGQINAINSEVSYPIVLDFDRIALLSKFIDADTKIAALEKPALAITTTHTDNVSINTTILCSIIK